LTSSAWKISRNTSKSARLHSRVFSATSGTHAPTSRNSCT
jgi:hypothetical protein